MQIYQKPKDPSATCGLNKLAQWILGYDGDTPSSERLSPSLMRHNLPKYRTFGTQKLRIHMPSDTFIPYEPIDTRDQDPETRAAEYRAFMDRRRSLRFFSDRPISKETIEHLIMTASSAPSGAHKQPWTFCAISSPDVKAKIRKAAEQEEYISYNGRMSQEWLEDLKKFDTDWNKPFIDTAPWIIILFKKAYDIGPNGEKQKNYYVNESVGIAAGMFISAVHNAGLVTLTHTPSPMNFLQELLHRPENERAFLLLPVGYPADDAVVPRLDRKKEEDVIVYY